MSTEIGEGSYNAITVRRRSVTAVTSPFPVGAAKGHSSKLHRRLTYPLVAPSPWPEASRSMMIVLVVVISSARTAQHRKDGRRRTHLNRARDLEAMSLVKRNI